MRCAFVVGAVLASTGWVSIAASQTLDGKGLYDSSVQLTNNASMPFSLRVRPKGYAWREETIEVGEAAWISCGNCVTSGFDVVFGEEGNSRQQFLPTGYRFSVKWKEDAWQLYVIPW
jgi:hypothetical protein